MAEAKVILTKSVNHLGHPGDVVTVKAGYARNYLIPQGLAFASVSYTHLTLPTTPYV